MKKILKNNVIEYARRLVGSSDRHIFLTGKAGTGKTTFLKELKKTTGKRMAIVAPTGIAAINAGGVTIHSLFQLPFGVFLPGSHFQQTIFSLRYSTEKKQLIQKLELLVIDEISMVRADLLDAIDQVLRHIRQQPTTPFGGVQMLFIGDLFQLPPVTKDEDKTLLSRTYASEFFFDALVVQQIDLVILELTHIFRQQDDTFIDLLNAIRNNTCTSANLATLNARCIPNFDPPAGQAIITLTTHNDKAEAINASRLVLLTEHLWTFPAIIIGEFSAKSYPADETLLLKKGAQVIFIKNDIGEARKYYNGKAGIIEDLSEQKILVRTQEGASIELERETWGNIRYHYNPAEGNIQEETLGSFKQFPVKLAWAITIHKSQGLTFESAIIDAGESFAAGQAYVAFSRLKSLNGLVLSSLLKRDSIKTNSKVVAFSNKKLPDDELELLLNKGILIYANRQIGECFSFKELKSKCTTLADKYPSTELIGQITKVIEECSLTVDKFTRQLDLLFNKGNDTDLATINARVSKAAVYFKQKVTNELISKLDTALANLQRGKGTKALGIELTSLRAEFEDKQHEIDDALVLVSGLINGSDFESLLGEIRKNKTSRLSVDRFSVSKNAAKTGTTQLATLDLFKKGLSVEQISIKRHIAVSTVEQHLAGFIASREIPITALLPQEKLERILQLVYAQPGLSAAQVRGHLGIGFSFAEIRFALEYQKIASSADFQPVTKPGNLFAL